MRAHGRVVHEIVHGEPAPLPPAASAAAEALVSALLERDEAKRLQQPAAARAPSPPPSRPFLPPTLARARAPAASHAARPRPTLYPSPLRPPSPQVRAHVFFSGVRWHALLSKQLASPLLPAVTKHAKGGGRGRGVAAGGGGPEALDVFSYPSNMMHMESILPRADGEAAGADGTSPADGGGATHASPAASGAPGSAAIADWDFVSPEPQATGARLWQRVRTRVDMLARVQGMSRCELLIYVLLTLAAHAATGVETSTERADGSELLF